MEIYEDVFVKFCYFINKVMCGFRRGRDFVTISLFIRGIVMIRIYVFDC